MSKITDEQLLEKEPYQSILKLLEICTEDENFQEGLTHGQILYVLQKNPKLKEEMEEIKIYIGGYPFSYFESIRVLSNGEYGIKRGCITDRFDAPQRLQEKIDVLIDRKWIEPIGRPRYRKYKLSKSYILQGKKRYYTEKLNRWIDEHPDEILFDQDQTYAEKEVETFFWNYTLFGLSEELLKNLSLRDGKNIEKWMDDIKTNLWNIMELKNNKLKMSKSNDIGFYYHASKKMIDEKIVDS